jgi:hypothetical protein
VRRVLDTINCGNKLRDIVSALCSQSAHFIARAVAERVRHYRDRQIRITAGGGLRAAEFGECTRTDGDG